MAIGVRISWRGPLRLGLASLAVAGASLSQAADIVVAHIAPFTGPTAVEAAEYNAGIRLALKAANAAGGINGQKLALRREDDEYNPDKAALLFNQVAASEAMAALLPIGSPAMTRVLKERIPETQKLPVVGVIPGAEPLRNPLNPYVYHVRAGDLDQYRKLVDHALTTGLNRIAVAYADIPFGAAGLAAIEGMLKKQNKEVVAKVPVAVGGKARLPEIMDSLAKATPDVVILVSPSQLAGEFLKAFREKHMSPLLAMPSYGFAEALCSAAGNDAARGVIIAQVMPNVTNTSIPVVRRFQDDLRKHGEKDMRPSILQLEGYVTTNILLEAMRRAGPGLTRTKLALGLDSLKKYDIGGFSVDFAATRHTGSNFVDISIVGRDCRLVY